LNLDGTFSSRRQHSGPKARPQYHLVSCNGDRFGLRDDGEARRAGRGSAVAPASWSAGSPLPLWQGAWPRLAFIPIATSSVGEMRKALMVKGIFRGQGVVRLAKAAEDCPHSKTLARGWGLRGARASRVLASASRRRELFALQSHSAPQTLTTATGPTSEVRRGDAKLK